jgi:PAS domain-containing protein
MEDITERKLAEERISEVIRQPQAILDHIPNAAWFKGREGRHVAVNDPFGRAFGLSSKDMVGKNDHEIYAPELAVKYEKTFRVVMTTGTRKFFKSPLLIGRGVFSTWRRSKRQSLMRQEWSSLSSASPMTLPTARKLK